ncbi:MAG: hypothetical protein B7Z54_04205 [Sphingobacteriales bacterium 12-47-4]|nr:MAG: hypothetical protein B7Z54_04205 [Sphingobacteriales bacterium 12-47-4]
MNDHRMNDQPNRMIEPLFLRRASILLLFLLWLTVHSQGQAVSVKARVDRSTILIGERLQLELEVAIPETSAIRFFSIDTIPHFEFIDKPAPDTLNTTDGTILRQRITLTSFDSGQWVIPALPLVEGEGPYTDSILVDVVFSPMDTSQPYHDVRDVMTEEVVEKKVWDWKIIITGVLAFVALFVFLVLYFFKRKKPATRTVPRVDILAETLREMEQIEQAKLDDKAYYIQVTALFRNYLHRRIGMDAGEKTSVQLEQWLKTLSVPAVQLNAWKEQWEKGELVKFAKGQVAQEDREQMARVTREVMRTVEEITLKMEAHANLAK